MSEAEAVIEEKAPRFQAIWLLPVLVVVIGAWVIAQNYLTEGPTIEISFETGAGMQAGKTKVKALSVEVGLVEEVRLADDLSSVIVTAKLDPGTGELLRDDTQLWVMRPRIGAAGISGLSTLLSGAYIELYPGTGTTGQRSFVGLENIPATAPGVPGLRLMLYSDRASSVGPGDPVLYRGLQVGKIESTTLDLDTSQMQIGAFIDAPYDRLVTQTTRFWNASGLRLEADANGVRVTAESLTSLVAGGVAFDLPAISEPGEPVASGATFRLYPDKLSSESDPYRFGKLYVVRFEQSLRGLEPGAPVEYRGIRVGTVVEILIDELGRIAGTAEERRVPVVIRAEPGRYGLGDSEEGVRQLEDSLAGSVAAGLRATLQTGNLITGNLYISFDHYADAEPAAIGEFKGYPTLPSRSGGLQRIERQVSTLLAKLNALPLDTTVGELNATLTQAKSLLATLREIAQSEDLQTLPGSVNAALAEIELAAASFSEGSQFYQRTNDTLAELAQTLQSLRALARTIEEKPNSLIFSSPQQPDPEPKAGAP